MERKYSKVSDEIKHGISAVVRGFERFCSALKDATSKAYGVMPREWIVSIIMDKVDLHCNSISIKNEIQWDDIRERFHIGFRSEPIRGVPYLSDARVIVKYNLSLIHGVHGARIDRIDGKDKIILLVNEDVYNSPLKMLYVKCDVKKILSLHEKYYVSDEIVVIKRDHRLTEINRIKSAPSGTINMQRIGRAKQLRSIPIVNPIIDFLD